MTLLGFFSKDVRTVLAIVAGAVFVLVSFCHYLLVQTEYFGFTCNTGIGLGLPLSGWPFEIVWVGVVGGLLLFAYLFRMSIFRSDWVFMSFVGILLGAISNKLDRALYGCVIDYFPFFDLFYYNVADGAICIGSFVLLYVIAMKK